MKHLTSSEFNGAVANGIVVVDFFATRCGPCQMIAPYLEDMAQKLEGNVSFYKVDVDEQRELAASQDITAMPTLKIFNNGEIVTTIVGADLQKLRQGIQRELEKANS